MGLYLIIMGVQGAGKGVQADYLKNTYNILHVSTGDLFRAMKAREDELAVRVQEIMKSGQLVPDDVTNEVLRDRLEKPEVAHKNGVLFDGYPRNIAQAEWLEAYLASRGESLTAALLLELDLYTAFKRAFGRVTSQSGASYNIFYNTEGIEWKFEEHPEKSYPPRLVAAMRDSGETLIRRPDDASAASILTRIDLYNEQTRPLIEHYHRKGLLRRIDANQSIDAVSADLRSAIDAARK